MSKSRKFFATLPSDSAIEEEFNLPRGSVYSSAGQYVLTHWMCKNMKVPRSFHSPDLYSYARYCAVEEWVCGTFTGTDWTSEVRASKTRRDRRWAF